jgi:hypothetical protein
MSTDYIRQPGFGLRSSDDDLDDEQPLETGANKEPNKLFLRAKNSKCKMCGKRFIGHSFCDECAQKVKAFTDRRC